MLRLVSLAWSNASIAEELGYGRKSVEQTLNTIIHRIWPAGFPSNQHRRIMLVLYYQRFYGGC